jgi:hypothetical protein
MAKAPTKVKWSIGADEPEDLQDFLSNDDIITKNTAKKTGEVNWPSKGPFNFRVQFVKVAKIQSGDNKGKDRLRVMLVLDDPKTKDWNGYAVFDGFNVTEQGAPFLKRFLRALGLKWSDFIEKSKQDTSQDPPALTQIGGVKFTGPKPATVKATVKVSPPDDYNTEEFLEIARWLPADDEEPEDLNDDEEVEEDEDEDEVEVVEDDDDDDDDEEWTREDLEDEDLDDIIPIAVSDFGLKKKDLKGLDKDEVLDLLFPGDEDDEDEDEDDEDEREEAIAELTAELNGLKVAALRKRARRNEKDSDEDFESMKKADLVQAIVAQEIPPF